MQSSSATFNYQNGSLNFPAPIGLQGAMMMCFNFQSDLQSLQKVCDNWLNIPSNQEVYYQPLLPNVLVTFSNYAGCYPLVAPFDNWGTIPYQELIFSIFVVRIKKVGDVWISEHVSALVPYIFVDDAIIMASGRELYGMPKAYGTIVQPTSPTETNKVFTVSTISTALFSKGVSFSNLILSSITQIADNNNKVSSEIKDLEIAVNEVKNLIFGDGHIVIPGLGLVIEIAELLVEKCLPFTSLRQFRSITSADTSCYKSIVDFNAKFQQLNGIGILEGTYQLGLPQNDLFPIASDLGLVDKQIALSAFWINWDFVFEQGTEVWTNEMKPDFWKRVTQLFKFKK